MRRRFPFAFVFPTESRFAAMSPADPVRLGADGRWPGLARRCAVVLLALAATASITHAANETPKRLNAIIFGPHPSAAKLAPRIQTALCAEHYTVDMHVNGIGGTPTLTKLKEIAGQGYAVLVIIAHGSDDGLSVEDFETEAEAMAKRNQYIADPANAWIKDHIDWGTVNEGDGTRYYVGLDDVGLYRLFGGTDPNRSIVIVLACHSWEMQNRHPNTGTFGATEYLGLEGAVSDQDFSRAFRGLLAMGGVEVGSPGTELEFAL